MSRNIQRVPLVVAGNSAKHAVLHGGNRGTGPASERARLQLSTTARLRLQVSQECAVHVSSGLKRKSMG